MSRALPLLLLALVALSGAEAGTRATCPRDARLGTVAYARAGALHLLDLGNCRDRVLVRRGATSAELSADGRYVAFGRGVASLASGRVFAGPWVATWAPTGHRMAAVSPGGGVVTGGPGLTTRRLVQDGFGATSLTWWGRSLAVGRYPRSGIWVVFPDGRRGVEADRLGANHNPLVALVSHGWILWWPLVGRANSANLDGRPLLGKRIAAGVGPGRFVPSMLVSGDHLEPCGQRLLVIAGADRRTAHGKSLLSFVAGNTGEVWKHVELSRDATRSWVSPACSPDRRRVAVSAGPDRTDAAFGRESRAVWVLSTDGRERRRLTTPPPGSTDETPIWSADGRAVLFVRTGPTRADGTATGTLYLATLQGTAARPIASLGRTTNTYGRYSWPSRIDVGR